MAVPTTRPIIDKIATLQRSELFANLSHDLLNKMADSAMIRHLNRGEVLASEHEEASGIYVVARGELRSVRQARSGREQVLSTERVGSTLGVVPVFNGGKFYSTLIADTNTDVLFIAKRDLHQFCRDHTELLWNLARVMAHKVRHYAELIESLALLNVEQRVALYLVTTAHDRGVRSGDGCMVELTMTRTEIASRLGSVREVVSRAMTHLQEIGLVQFEGRRLVNIPDMQELRKFAGGPAEWEHAKLASEISSELA